MSLLDQANNQHIVARCTPKNDQEDSFGRPKCEQNVATGAQNFTLSATVFNTTKGKVKLHYVRTWVRQAVDFAVTDNPKYFVVAFIVDDTMFFKCEVDPMRGAAYND